METESCMSVHRKILPGADNNRSYTKEGEPEKDCALDPSEGLCVRPERAPSLSERAGEAHSRPPGPCSTAAAAACSGSFEKQSPFPCLLIAGTAMEDQTSNFLRDARNLGLCVKSFFKKC